LKDYLKKISKERNGARFYKVDIHIHTPSSSDQKYLNKKNSKAFGFPKNQKDLIKIFGKQGDFDSAVKKIADKFVEKFIEKGLNLIVFTDHNTPSFIDNDDWEKGNWYEAVKNAIKKAEKDKRIGKGKIKVLPGVELTTARVHILTVFNDLDEKGMEDELAPFNIANLLNGIGFRANDVGEFISRTGGRSVYHALKLIIEYGGVPVIAHIDGPGRSFGQSDFKFKKEKRKGGKQAIKFEFKGELEAIISISELAVMEYVDKNARIIDNLEKSETWMEALTELRNEAKISKNKKGIKPELTFVRNSDAHKFEDIAKRYSYVKMDDLNYRSFFYAFREPKNRVWPDVKGEPTEPKYQIDGMAIAGGFIDSAVHRFNPWINCIVGNIASGKTTRIHNLGRALKDLTGTQETFDNFGGDASYVTLRIKDGGNQSLWALKTDLKTCKTNYRKLGDNYKQLGKWQGKPNELNNFRPEFILGWKIDKETRAKKNFQTPLAEQCWSVIEEKIKSSQNSPLIIDELEQCLTDEIIEQKLIPALDKCRTDRQIIISSTKSNIPIVLDVENIIIVDREKILAAGSIEHERILPLLFRITEGGEKTHQEKFRRYGHILKVET